jgi:hypothetical protein
VTVFPRDPGAQWRVFEITAVVGRTSVVVVARLLGVVVEGADEGAPAEGAEAVDVVAEFDCADAVEFFATALDSP